MNTEHINPFDLPSVSIEKRWELPAISAIYFVLSREEILYIGKTTSLRQRWTDHHQLSSLQSYSSVRIAWLDVGKVTPAQLSSLEEEFIGRFSPSLNSAPVYGVHEIGLSYLSSPQWQEAMQRAENPTWQDYTRK